MRSSSASANPPSTSTASTGSATARRCRPARAAPGACRRGRCGRDVHQSQWAARVRGEPAQPPAAAPSQALPLHHCPPARVSTLPAAAGRLAMMPVGDLRGRWSPTRTAHPPPVGPWSCTARRKERDVTGPGRMALGLSARTPWPYSERPRWHRRCTSAPITMGLRTPDVVDVRRPRRRHRPRRPGATARLAPPAGLQLALRCAVSARTSLYPASATSSPRSGARTAATPEPERARRRARRHQPPPVHRRRGHPAQALRITRPPPTACCRPAPAGRSPGADSRRTAAS